MPANWFLPTWICLLVVGIGGHVQAQTATVAGSKAVSNQIGMIVSVASADRQCTSISSKSRLCHFTFAAECKKRGETKQHCAQMDGFCHACTDQYAMCKGDAAQAGSKSGKPSDCGACNAAYDRCIESMVKQYGGKLITVR